MKSMKMGKGESHEAPKKLSHIEIHPSDNDGHMVKHVFDNSAMSSKYHEPEEHVFSSEQGSQAMEHIASAANINAAAGDGKPEHSEEIESEEGEKS